MSYPDKVGFEMSVAVVTDRLQLMQLDLNDAVSMLDGERPIGHQWAAGYPTERSLVAAGMLVAADVGAFGTFLMVRRDDGVVIGDCGFHGPPDSTGAVTIGFEVVPEVRGSGYATEAVEALLAYARTLPGVVTVHAETAGNNAAAQAVLEKAGMTAVTGGDLVHYIA
jgi:RimJ/RimL family protein N-acetyltransferase